MERLTVRCDDGLWELVRNDNDKLMGQLEKVPAAIARLAAYEDTGLEPEEIMALIPPPNAPLTLEELREMDGEPKKEVYICGATGIPCCWCQPGGCNNRKPEEGR